MLFNTDDFPTYIFHIICVALALVIIVVGGGYAIWLNMTKNVADGDYHSDAGADIDSSTIAETTPSTQNDDVFGNSVTVTDDNAPLNMRIREWMDNGVAVSDENVTNILLIGMDVNTPDMDKNSRADAMVLFSVNHKTQAITLASLMRDQYCYLPVNGGSFEKLHHANSYGGPSMQIQIIEKYYKVKIDNYAVVNFYSLPKIINALGGVTVDVTENEASFLNSECGFNISSGENEFDGNQALVYMRIRKGNTGGDEGRTIRQQKVIKQILAGIRSYSKTSMLSLVNKLLPYVRTGYNSTELLGFAADAVVNGWLKYDIKQATLPGGNVRGECTINKIWYWKVDYPLAARELQLLLYGRSNIVLDADRKGWTE